MRHAGGLRIDHVMGLQHLYWIPAGHARPTAPMSHYPLDDLLGILALEATAPAASSSARTSAPCRPGSVRGWRKRAC